jgi:hypothetical protein
VVSTVCPPDPNLLGGAMTSKIGRALTGRSRSSGKNSAAPSAAVRFLSKVSKKAACRGKRVTGTRAAAVSTKARRDKPTHTAGWLSRILG